MNEARALAAIDIGSNSILLETATVVDGHIRPQLHRKETVRLGGALDADNLLQPEAMQRGWECLSRYAQLIAHIPPAQRRVAATQTLREAANRDVFLQEAARILQCPVEVISGELEAALIYQGVCLFLPERNDERLVVDIGGRSTELCWGRGMQLQHAHSCPVGSVAWAQRFFPEGDLSEAAFARAHEAALQLLAPTAAARAHLARHPHTHVYGASGTAGAISKILSAHGHAPGSITREALWGLRDQLQQWGHTSRIKLQGLRPELLPVIGGGISLMCAVFAALDLHHMRMAQGALRHGLLASMLHSPDRAA